MNKLKLAKEFIREIGDREKTNLSFASIYGSVSKGADTKESDIDILLVVDKNKESVDNLVHKIVIKYLKESGEVISPIVLNKSEFQKSKKLKTPYITNVLEGKILHGA